MVTNSGKITGKDGQRSKELLEFSYKEKVTAEE